MSGYERFQEIMAEINYKISHPEEEKLKNNLPPGFEELFKGFKK